MISISEPIMAELKTGTSWCLGNAGLPCWVSSFRTVVKPLLFGVSAILAGKNRMCFQIYGKSTAMARLQYCKCFDGRPTGTASQVGTEKEDQYCICFSPGSSHLTPNAAFATGLLPPLRIHFNGIGPSLPVLCLPWIPPSHPPSEQILTEQ